MRMRGQVEHVCQIQDGVRRPFCSSPACLLTIFDPSITILHTMMLHHFCTESKILSIDTKLASVGSKLVTLDKMAEKTASKNMRICLKPEAGLLPMGV